MYPYRQGMRHLWESADSCPYGSLDGVWPGVVAVNLCEEPFRTRDMKQIRENAWELVDKHVGLPKDNSKRMSWDNWKRDEQHLLYR